MASQELKLREWSRYKAYYCGVCRAMKKFTTLGRLLLSYDITFYALLTDIHAQAEIKTARCGWNLKKKMFAAGSGLDYSAAVSVILSYYKALDDVKDGGASLSPLLKPALKSAAGFAAGAESTVRTRLEELSKKEKDECAVLDQAADSFACLVAQVCAGAPGLTDTERRIVHGIGYAVGRWIYIIDAWDDLNKDKKSGNYNAVSAEAKRRGIQPEAMREQTEQSLYCSLDDAVKCAELLPESVNKPIVLNILQYGMYDKTVEVMHKKEH